MLPAHPTNEPQRLDRYWLGRRLGTGGQGVVYEAYADDGTRVAVKVLHHASGRIAKEVEAAQRVASFCTARVIEARLDAPRPYIVSEYVDGPSLRQAVQQGRVFAGDDLRRLATGMATALAAIHQAGVVHRDLKPANVLLGPDGPRVIDFGIARTEDMSLTTAQVVAGTPTYMAPEVIAGERAGTAADIFAWGAVVLFAATARDPFEAESLGGVMYQVLSREPDTGMLVEPLRSLVPAALAKDPQARPSAAELLWALVGGLDLAGGSRTAAGLVRPRVSERALGELAEEVYERLGQNERDLVPEVFLRMVEADEEGADAVRRVPREELTDGRREADEVITAFSRAGLISAGDGSVMIAHPALLRAWPQLRAWLDDEREGLAVHRGLTRAARQWHTGGRRDGDLYQGSALEHALSWAATGRRRLSLNSVESDFLAAASRLTRRRTTRRRLVSAALAVLLAVALGAGGYAEYQRRTVAEQRDQALAKDAARRAESLRVTDPLLSRRLAVAAWRLAPVTEARSALYGAQTQRELDVFADPDQGLGVRALSPDGTRLASVRGGQARVWDVKAARVLRQFAVRDAQALALGPGALAVLDGGSVVVHDLRSGAAVTPDVPGVTAIGYDGDVLVLRDEGGVTLWRDGTLFERRGSGLGAVAVGAGWVALVNQEGQVELWDRQSGRRTRTFPVKEAYSLAFSPGDNVLAVGTRAEIAFYEPATGAHRVELTMSQPRAVELTFTGRGEHLLVTQSDSLGHSYEAMALWRLDEPGGRPWRYSFGYEYPETVRVSGTTASYLTTSGLVPTVDLAPDLASRAADGEAPGVTDAGGRLVVTRRGEQVAAFTASTPQGSFQYALHGSLLAYGEQEGDRVRLWDVRQGKETAVLDAPVGPLRFSPDGQVLAIGNQIWDVRSRKLTRTIAEISDVVAIGPKGQALANALAGTWYGLGVDVTTGARTALPLGYIGAAAFSPDGRTVAVGDNDGRLQFLDAATWRRIGPSLGGHTDDIGQIVFSPDGTMAATSGNDTTLRLWDVAGQRPLGLPIEPVSGESSFASGRLHSGGVPVLDLDGDRAAAAVCAAAGRGLDEREWSRHLPGVAFRETCPR
ncbi:WD40 repeat domain-containing serine/threonine-protein kinase [Nonomuraea soli]|uniref:WD40 repeat protein n=1 Tax=Nonomuraea soli TaxID=1032476 RepID=A0A7W0HTF8_9ACTN|nr:WD40 repeat domain-containing serine/threonine-protein kinase [Nonomuraea soli]MBA2895074.1 WD40 repeat protein [Nonomuraea soli]